ncbi:MAG TPA: hypothetical protein VK034_19310 [Enhygromyxa sp.]|nr:hypothetical protein [Enhygromyxa sp.]
MTKPHYILLRVLCATALAAALACDQPCESTPKGPGNQDPQSLESCPPLPPGVEPIEGLAVGHAVERFGGLALTLSTRPLACGEVAAQHGYCSYNGNLGLTVGLTAEQTVIGEQPLAYPVYVEFETPELMSVGGGLGDASIELFAITDTCVTGRLIGLVDHDGPFEGGFQARRCEP